MPRWLSKVALALFVMYAVFVCALPAIAQQKTGGRNWGYSGADGAEHWGDLSPDYAACKNGKRQSPVNIAEAKPAELAPIHFDYQMFTESRPSLRSKNSSRAISWVKCLF